MSFQQTTGFFFLKLFLLPREVPDPPRHVLQPRVPLLRAPHRVRAEPCLVQVGLIVAGDDLLDEVAGRGEVAALAEEQGGAVAADSRLAGVEDGVEVAVDPVVVAHHRRRRRRTPARSGDGKCGGEAEGERWGGPKEEVKEKW